MIRTFLSKIEKTFISIPFLINKIEGEGYLKKQDIKNLINHSCLLVTANKKLTFIMLPKNAATPINKPTIKPIPTSNSP